MRLIQATREGGTRGLVVVDGGDARWLMGEDTVYSLALRAAREGASIEALAGSLRRGEEVDTAALQAAGRILLPIDHPDPAHVCVAGTGLTHLGSAAARDKMHRQALAAEEEPLTDSMKMFRMGVEGGKPAPGMTGVQPEWFFKGDGAALVPSGGTLRSPAFADDAGEEPEVAGIYVIAEDGTPCRVGFALCNEFSDHVMERQNYLWLAHSKLRPCSLGPELLLGDLPDDVRGTSRIRRGEEVIFDKEFLTGEANMSHSIANLEAHHFKYQIFRRPGDVHVHSFGTGTASFADGIRTEAGDIFEIEAPLFGLPLVNSLAVAEETPVAVRQL